MAVEGAALVTGAGRRLGRAMALALAARGATVTAWDAAPARMADLPVRAARAGADIEVVRNGRPRGDFDVVLTDVPCSGSGTWRRTPDAKWRLTQADLERLVTVQAEILDLIRDLSAARGTGACHSKKFMPMSKSRLQSAWLVTMPASIHRLFSRWSSNAKSPWVWRVMYSIGP